jgi:hypothetical protein
MISQADDDELDALSFTQPQAGPSVPPSSSSQAPISGRIGQSNAPKSTTFGGVIYQKLLQVLYPPKGNGTNQLLR